MSARKTYLGDGVYADLEDGMVKLTTENGLRTSNTIYLEHETLIALEQYVAYLRRELAEQNAGRAVLKEGGE